MFTNVSGLLACKRWVCTYVTFFHACFRASLLLPSCRLLSITFTSVFITSVKRNRSQLLKFLLLFFLSMALSSRTSPRHNHSRRSDVANRNAPVQLGRQASRSGFGPAVSNLRLTSATHKPGRAIDGEGIIETGLWSIAKSHPVLLWMR